MSCERCGFTHYREQREDGELASPELGELWWSYVDGVRTRLCLGCVAELRWSGSTVRVQ